MNCSTTIHISNEIEEKTYFGFATRSKIFISFSRNSFVHCVIEVVHIKFALFNFFSFTKYLFFSIRFYVRNHLPTPDVTAKEYELDIASENQNKEITLSLEDLKSKFEKVEVTSAIQCGGKYIFCFHEFFAKYFFFTNFF